MAYLIDTNVFIQAKDLNNGIDESQGFWKWLDKEFQADQVFSIERVRDELLGKKDELSDWALERDRRFFLPADATMYESFRKVSEWATRHGYEQSAIHEFFRVADYYLTVQAHAGQHSILTCEVKDNKKNKIKIPNVCSGLGITCVNPSEMLRSECARFVLDVS